MIVKLMILCYPCFPGTVVTFLFLRLRLHWPLSDGVSDNDAKSLADIAKDWVSYLFLSDVR